MDIDLRASVGIMHAASLQLLSASGPHLDNNKKEEEEDETLFLSHYCMTLQEIASPPNEQHADVWRLHPDSPLLTWTNMSLADWSLPHSSLLGQPPDQLPIHCSLPAADVYRAVCAVPLLGRKDSTLNQPPQLGGPLHAEACTDYSRRAIGSLGQLRITTRAFLPWFICCKTVQQMRKRTADIEANLSHVRFGSLGSLRQPHH